MLDRREQRKLFRMLDLDHIQVFFVFDLRRRWCLRFGISLARTAARHEQHRNENGGRMSKARRNHCLTSRPAARWPRPRSQIKCKTPGWLFDRDAPLRPVNESRFWVCPFRRFEMSGLRLENEEGRRAAQKLQQR